MTSAPSPAEADSGAYAGIRDLVASPNPGVRRQVAARADVPGEVLYFLAADSDIGVRLAVAGNASAPARANLLLAEDREESVRGRLAAKVGRIPEDEDREKRRQLTHQVLSVLSRDHLPTVRRILAETLKDVAHAPPDVIVRLARDVELTVAAPVLEFSPVLSEEDLLDIVSSPPAAGARSAVSRRVGVSERISDAIAGTDDREAIAELLTNTSAQIREETLDTLIERAPRVKVWHEPLARRPKLSPHGARKLAQFVADNVLQVLAARSDLDPETVALVVRQVQRRIADGEAAGVPGPAPLPGTAMRTPVGPGATEDADEDTVASALSQARKMHAAGTLDERVMLQAMSVGAVDFVAAGLSLRSGLALDAVERILRSGNAKAVIAIAWRGGCTPEFAVQLQGRVARLPPSKVLKPLAARRFPLREDEMEMQIAAFLTAAPSRAG